MAYPFVPAKFDYGRRKGPALALMLHMAEGGNTVHYLGKNGRVKRGVSVHFVCDVLGRVTQMLPLSHASGSLNPANLSTNKAFYGKKHLDAVLGSWASDPNSAVISIEIEGFAAKGPNPKQVSACIAWGLDMKRELSTLRGALGHADQTNTKACPGTSPAMKAIFEGVGGHGLWHPQSGPAQPAGGDMLKVSDPTPALIDFVKDVEVLDPAGKHLTFISPGGVAKDAYSPFEAELGANAHYRACFISSSGVRQLGLIHVPDANVHPITSATPAPPPPPDLKHTVTLLVDGVLKHTQEV